LDVVATTGACDDWVAGGLVRLYERLWRGFWAVVATIGVGVGLLAWSVLGVLLALGSLVVLCWLTRQVLANIVPGSPAWGTTLGGLLQSLTVAVGILAVCSFGLVSPPLGLFVALTAGVSSPPLVRRALVSSRGPTAAKPDSAAPDPAKRPEPEEGDSATQLTLPEALGPLNGLDDRQLCRLWRQSFWILRSPAPPGTVLCVVALREACLDELERRDSAALHAWLDSGARASSGPEKYMAHPR
jgi:hypothetical protein